MLKNRIITKEKFIERVGREPISDDLERCNCQDVGKVGHHLCGWSEEFDLPMFMCPGKKVKKRELSESGIFDSVYDSEHYSEISNHEYEVKPSLGFQQIPNVGILPIPFTNSINIILEKGVPDEILPYLQDSVSDMVNKNMCEATYHGILNEIIYTLQKLVAEKRLYRYWQNPNKWIFEK